MYDERWQRWIRASVNTFFKTNIEARGYVLYLEGDDRNTSDLDDFIELRMDGPYHREIAHNDFRLKIEVNLLVQSTIGNQKNLYIPEDIVGMVTAFAAQPIPVFTMGETVAEHIGCFTVDDKSSRDVVRVSDFGMIETDVPLRQFTVECHYKIELEGI